MKIATYNILKGGTQRVHWARMIEDYAVDLLLVQESYPHHEHLPPLIYPDAGKQSAWEMAEKNGWGSGVFSRTGSVKPVPVPNFSGWVVGAEIAGASWQVGIADPLLAFSVHAPSKGEAYWKQVNKLLDEIKKVAAGREAVIGGDFNLTVSHWPGPERPTCKQDLAIQARLAEEFGLLDCWQAANSDQPLCQTLRWTGDRTIPYHCDGIFVPQLWKGRLQSCVVLAGEEWERLSDHNPVVACFKSKRLRDKRRWHQSAPVRSGRLLERIEKRIRLLGTGQRDLVVDDEERHALDSKAPSQFLGFLQRLQAVAAVQVALGPGSVQPGLGNHVQERLALADVPALGEVGPEQRLHHSTLNTFRVGQPDQPVGVEGVRCPLDHVEGEVDAFGLPDLDHPVVEFERPLPATELLGPIFPPADPFLRHHWVQLKRQPAHLDLVLFGGDGLLQPALADEAPGADHVGNHVNVENHDNHRTGQRHRLSTPARMNAGKCPQVPP